MTHYTWNIPSLRLSKAMISRQIGHSLESLMLGLSGVLIALGIGIVIGHHHQGLVLAGLGVMLGVLYTWVHRDLRNLEPATVNTTTSLDQLLPSDLLGGYHPNMSAQDLWNLLVNIYETKFLVARFSLKPDELTAAIAGMQLNHDQLWETASGISTKLQLSQITVGTTICALFALNQALSGVLTAHKLSQADFEEGALWLAREEDYSRAKRPLYGGLARDWASGYTPMLSQFGTNLSMEIEYASRKFGPAGERTTQLDTLVTGLESASGSVVLVGEPGIGKTALLMGLADRLLQGDHVGSLKHYQIISLNASLILSNTQGQGDLERTVLALFNEAAHAGNMVIALDEAQLFFGEGPGAVNLSQILLPILQAHALKLVLAITPGDWQRLKATNSGMASLLTPLVLSEPDQVETIRLMADHAVIIERNEIITWNALLEAYRLSGRYLQDEAYPGRGFKVLEAALNFPNGLFVTEQSVQLAIEQEFGVKVQQASATETDVLLHLEDKIHERMINQTRAVSVVASALRRARAGVANPRRPIGSFLFLGPTGVGKTELARSLAALYFGAEDNVIRLDMSEYQQVADVDRILGDAISNSGALLPRVRQAPFSVVLFDEIEKAHPNVLNLFLQLLDEGNLTDISGHAASFKDAIVIATSNAGAEEIRERIEAGQELETFEQQFTNDLISSGIFKPELLNRFDEIVLFRPLNEAELGQVVRIMVAEVNKTLANQKISVELDDEAVAMLVTQGYDPRLGARPMRRMVTRRVEDSVASRILKGEAKPGSVVHLGATDLSPGGAGPQTAQAPAPAPGPSPEPKPVTETQTGEQE
jgi:ATP-dependent Clp protease ATP-binding subunit ClpC